MNFLAAAIFLATATTTPPAMTGPVVTIVTHHGTIYQTDKAGDPSEGFFEIDNTGAADTLTAVSCPIADVTSLVAADGTPISSLPVPALQNTALTAKTPHILLQHTHFSIQYGGIIPCSATFANAGTMSIFLYAIPKPKS